jgi:pimeloyl-ACP methyl ester carboxylesterase
MATIHKRQTPPNLLTIMLEPIRTVAQLGRLVTAHPLLKRIPKGDGHTVLVLPGFLASDSSTKVLRNYLTHWGYDAHGWDLGTNLGVSGRSKIEQQVTELVLDLTAKVDGKITIIGWSLGGVIAREIAREYPQHIKQVITLGSPIGGHPSGTSVWRLYETIVNASVDDDEHNERLKVIPQNIPGVPSTAIYTVNDGVVSWRIAREKSNHFAENVHVFSSHLGLGFSPAAFYVIADRLAQSEGKWKPFNKKGLRRLVWA